MSGAWIVMLFVATLVLAASLCLPKDRRPPVPPDDDRRRDRDGIDRANGRAPASLKPHIDEG
ncbi:hypothetical protein FHS31_002143 [Sphingomonas vulcanisoli]|uniref:Uncharacterized protein n=1 Tax=Sphingomonas vulcanisoli TaxID=1658060 RepID=A0ABX0TSQ2_9SPHN|nr:hypothetical protein [Sphingomonas vulcanisoli]